ncbi:MAG: hypothetical protein IKD70_02615 [Eggerthellaceae bacterium]|nr:hypothetical protein [Eggerthellaceae bacterium]
MIVYSLPKTMDTRAIVGAAGSGKTEALLRAALESATQGSVLVLVAQPQAIPMVTRRLAIADVTGAVSSRIMVKTPRELALDILASDAARAFTGREPYVLTPGEEDIVIGDLQTCGLDGKRLREMFKFFKKSFTELADAEPGFLVSSEERTVMDLFKDIMACMRGMLECEVSAQAVKFLRQAVNSPHADAADGCAEFMYDFVLADDCDLLSAASQELGMRVARRGFLAAGNPDNPVPAFESYPAPAAFTAFVESAAAVERLEVPATPAAVLHAAFPSPEQELLGVAAQVRELVVGGVDARDICIAAPNRTWLKNLISGLRHAGVETDTLSAPNAFTITTGEPEKTVPSRALAALALIVNPTDSGAWRMWCAFDDLMAETVAFQTIREKLRERQQPIPVVLERYMLDTPNEESALRVDRDLARAWDLITACGDLTGPELIETIGMQLDEHRTKGFRTFARLCNAQAGESAAVMYARIRRLLSLPATEGHGIFVGTYSQVVGLSPRIMMLPGFVNGFFPDARFFDDTVNSIEKRRKMNAADRALLSRVTGTARERVLVTSFNEADLDAASILRVKIDRIRLKGDRRVCTIPVSDFLEELLGPTDETHSSMLKAPTPAGTINSPTVRTLYPR